MEAFERAWLDMRPYDLMCLDYQMPGPDGMEVLSQIRKKEEQLGVGPLARLRVIMVTARSEIGVVLSFLAAGCDEYIVKPFDAATVHDKIKGIFEAPLPPLEPGRQPDGE
jgi:two-component system chemotaxis response regulator CheY